MQGYRRGHNEAVLKTVGGNPRGFESHSLRQNDRYNIHLSLYALVAQSEEHMTFNHGVGSSSLLKRREQ